MPSSIRTEVKCHDLCEVLVHRGFGEPVVHFVDYQVVEMRVLQHRSLTSKRIVWLEEQLEENEQQEKRQSQSGRSWRAAFD